MVTAADIRTAFPDAFTVDDDGALTAAIQRAQRVHSAPDLGDLYDDAITYYAAGEVSSNKSSGARGGLASATAGPASVSYFATGGGRDSNPFWQRYDELIRTATAHLGSVGGVLSSV